MIEYRRCVFRVVVLCYSQVLGDVRQDGLQTEVTVRMRSGLVTIAKAMAAMHQPTCPRGGQRFLCFTSVNIGAHLLAACVLDAIVSSLRIILQKYYWIYSNLHKLSTIHLPNDRFPYLH